LYSPHYGSLSGFSKPHKGKIMDLRELYANEVIDGMNDKEVRQYAFDALYDCLKDMTDNDLAGLVEMQYPHLLEGEE
jgi:hypothetical protein